MKSKKKVRVKTLKIMRKKAPAAKKRVKAAPARHKSSNAKVRKHIQSRVVKIAAKAVKSAVKKSALQNKMAVAKERHSRKRNDISLKVLTAETVESLKKDKVFSEYLNEKIGSRTDEVILSLAAPVTDEGLAEKLGMKINDTRRVLNMLNTSGVARYIVNKNSKGWLTFKWYIDEENLKKMRGEVAIKATTNNTTLPENCNDYYVCGKCYSKTKLVYPFEVGYEMNFKCDGCGSYFERKSKEDIEKLIF